MLMLSVSRSVGGRSCVSQEWMGLVSAVGFCADGGLAGVVVAMLVVVT